MKNMFTANFTRRGLLVFCVALLSIACVSIVGSVEAELMMQAAPQTSPKIDAAPQTTPGEKTVEQVQKNIQVLNGLPQSQLIPVMNYMGASLGVKCTFCHVRNGDKLDPVSDEKPEKKSARAMIKMVQDINKGNFKGDLEVTCFTCHRGSERPARVPQLPLAVAAPLAESPAAGSPKETPPTADQILARYTEALGGMGVIKTRSMKGTVLTSDGSTIGYEIYQSAPDRFFSILNTPKQGVFERGFDGQTAWEKSDRGIRDLEGNQISYLKRYSNLFRDIKLQGQFTRLSYGGKEKIDGRDVYVLRGLGVDGKGERLYFDAQTGLLVRRLTSTPTMVGLIPEQVDYEDYRDVDGNKMPFTIRISSTDPSFSTTRKFTEIKLNVPVDETRFKKPPSPAPSPQATP